MVFFPGPRAVYIYCSVLGVMYLPMYLTCASKWKAWTATSRFWSTSSIAYFMRLMTYPRFLTVYLFKNSSFILVSSDTTIPMPVPIYNISWYFFVFYALVLICYISSSIVTLYFLIIFILIGPFFCVSDSKSHCPFPQHCIQD